MTDALFSNKIISSRDIPTLLNLVLCDPKNILCANRECQLCKDKRAIDASKITASVISYHQWERVMDDNHFVLTKCIQVGKI